jgi:type IV pilus assembly protein PilV
MRQAVPIQQQSGVALLEALISILIFSLGILALVGLQSMMIRTSIDAKYRADAATLANQIVGAMWAADRTNATSFKNNFELNAGDPACDAGTNSAEEKDDALAAWLAQVENAAVLPGAIGLKQQIVVGDNNLVTVTLCWKNVQDSVEGSQLEDAPPHRFVLSAQMPANN